MILETGIQHELEKPDPVKDYLDGYFKGNIFTLTSLRVLCVSNPESLGCFFFFVVLIPYLDSSNIPHFSCGYFRLFPWFSRPSAKNASTLCLDIQ